MPLPGQPGPGLPAPGPQQPVPGQPLPQFRDPLNLQRPWVRGNAEAFQGFPVFPGDFGGYGIYPQSLTPVPPILTGALPPPPLVSTAPDWPSWVKTKERELPYEPGLAVLVRQADRVWFSLPEEPVAVPLYFWDATRALGPGSEVEVRRTGEFLLLFHGGSRLGSFGAGRVIVQALDEDKVQLRIPAFTRMRIAVGERPFVIELPDGSSLHVDRAPKDEAPRFAHVDLERADEPEWHAGRASIQNLGERPLRWQTPSGEVEIAPSHKCLFFLTPPPLPVAHGLVATGVSSEAIGAARRFVADPGGGTVSFSGARIELPAGAVLELDPLLGAPFAAATGRQAQ